MIHEILETGFSEIELSHGMTIAKLPGIQAAFKNKAFTCCGVHNYFPAPVEVMIDAPDAYEFTSHRPFDRKRVMDMTKKSLEIAAEFHAKYLVLHMGSVPLKASQHTHPLTEMVAEGQQRSHTYIKKKISFIKKREKLSPLYYHRAIAALEELGEVAREHGVKLAIESRSRFEDLPNEREMLRLQDHFKDHPYIGYWHDLGHVQLKHNLGFLDHYEWLETISPHLIGGHFHDVEWPARDHRTPLTASLDFDKILEYFPEQAPIVWELSPTRKKAEIQGKLAEWKIKYPTR